MIEEAFIDASIGSRVDFYRPSDQRIPLKAAPEGLEGEVIWAAEGSIVVGEGELVYINRGSVDGVEPGQCYELYRAPAAGSSPPLKYGSRDYHTQRPVSKKHLTTTIGEMMILRTQETTSSALVIESDLPLELGELFRAGCPRLEQLAKAEEPPPVAPIPPPPEEDWARRQFENKDINFAFDSYALDTRAREILEEKARFLKERSGLNILIEGHCDERGTEQYNLALGDRRAHASKQYLIGLGILEARMSTVSYGEERPLDPGHNEGAWAKNRRAHFIILNP